MKLIADISVKDKFESYPLSVRNKMYALRDLLLKTAEETEGLEVLEEALKWGEPSYITKNGSTIRMDWKPARPDEYAMYFHCQTKLVDTFKELYGDKFRFEGNRAMVFAKNEKIPVDELKHCIALALNYHKVKHLPLLGA
ncbi:MAG: DUF1801 domain-containing protein [Gammaproteobacteria bacterium]|nr:DUF1801 domain-containing protein [Gammaproteobacteria bacterium]